VKIDAVAGAVEDEVENTFRKTTEVSSSEVRKGAVERE